MDCCSCQRFEEDAVQASVMMVHTFNKDREKVKAAVDIISKWVAEFIPQTYWMLSVFLKKSLILLTY